MTEPLPVSKVDRAKQHLAEFNAACKKFVSEHPYTIRKQRKDQRRQTVKLLPTPPYLGLIFGDFVHNLRSALDYAVAELTANNASNLSKKELKGFRRRSGFPICTSPDQWDSDWECSNGGLDKVGGVVPDGIAAIERMQPFRDTTNDPQYHPLALLAHLDNRDKHRRLNTTSVDALLFQGETSPGNYWIAPVQQTRKGLADPIVTVPKMEVQLQVALAISLTDKGPAPGALLWVPELSLTIRRMVIMGNGVMFPDWLLGHVRDIVETLEGFLV